MTATGAAGSGSAAGSGPGAGADVVVVGGGLVGTLIAWRLGQRGVGVLVVDDDRPGRASMAAAGMLAAVAEAAPTEAELSGLLVTAARRYRAEVAELEAATGISCGYRALGTLVVGTHADDVALIAELHRRQLALGLRSEPVGHSALLEREPALGPGVRAGLFAADDHQVDPRRLLAAATAAAAGAGVQRRAGTVTGIDAATGRVALEGGERLAAGTVVVAAGAWARLLPGLEPLAVRPVKGQILRLRTDDGRPACGPVVRGVVHGREVYLVARDDGELVVGATSEEQGFDRRSTAGGVHGLLRDARVLLPNIDEYELVEHRVGFRPGTPMNGPLVGPAPAAVAGGGGGAAARLVLAVGHHRNGVLLAPLTATAVADQLTGGPDAALFAPFLHQFDEQHGPGAAAPIREAKAEVAACD